MPTGEVTQAARDAAALRRQTQKNTVPALLEQVFREGGEISAMSDVGRGA